MNTVLYDDHCMLCRTLAAWGAARAGASLQFQSWQSYYGPDASPPTVLRVISGGDDFDGPDAWAFLLTQVPDLSALNWLAQRLGIQAGVARALHSAGSVTRRLCRSCGKKPWEQGAR